MTIQDDDNDIEKWDSTKINTSTYQSIYEKISTFNRLLNYRNRSTDTKLFTCLVGYQLINLSRNNALRGENHDYKIHQAILLSSKEYRTPRFANQPKQNTNTILPDNGDHGEQIVETDIVAVVKEARSKVKNKCCCVKGCDNTTYINSKLSFTRVPVVSMAKIVKSSTNRN